ncbi:MAG: sensor histidine kinase [Acidimicrobiia bacterium]|nr:sensor histidine kinase [Acidimicrobiia bacterium]
MARRRGGRSSLARSLSTALALIGVLGLVIGGSEIAMFASEDAGPVWLLGLFPAAGFVFLGAGLEAWRRRPSNRTGSIMVVGAASWFLVALANTTVTALVVVGVVLATAPLALVVWLLHAFPSGRLRSAVSRRTVGAGFLVALLLQVPLYLFDPTTSPDGVLSVADRADLVDVGKWFQRGAGLVVMFVTAAVLVDRSRSAPPGQRRVLLPLYAYGSLAVLAVPLGPILGPSLGLSVELVVTAQIALVAGVPLAFAAAMLRGGFARTGEVQELGAWLALSTTSREPLVEALGRTLGDPSLELLYWSTDRAGFVDGDGAPSEPPTPEGRRRTVDIELGSKRVGTIVYDAAVIDDPELVRSAGQVAAIAIDHERLTADLRASRAALQRSRARLVDAGDRERRRIAQNLHDGLQVELVLLALEAQQLARLDGSAELAGAATRLRGGIDGAARHLRELVHAVMPAALVERGLTAAVEDLVDRMPVPTRLELVQMNGRLPARIESTAYFVVAEALTNAVKHAGATTLAVTLEHAPKGLVIGVADDGVGGACQRDGDGVGLRGLADRVDAVGGQLTIDSPLGRGTQLLVELPCGS